MKYQLNYIYNKKCLCNYFKTKKGIINFLKRNNISDYCCFDLDTLEEITFDI